MWASSFGLPRLRLTSSVLTFPLSVPLQRYNDDKLTPTKRCSSVYIHLREKYVQHSVLNNDNANECSCQFPVGIFMEGWQKFGLYQQDAFSDIASISRWEHGFSHLIPLRKTCQNRWRSFRSPPLVLLNLLGAIKIVASSVFVPTKTRTSGSQRCRKPLVLLVGKHPKPFEQTLAGAGCAFGSRTLWKIATRQTREAAFLDHIQFAQTRASICVKIFSNAMSTFLHFLSVVT